MTAYLSLWPQSTRNRTTAWMRAYQRSGTYRSARRRERTRFWMRAAAFALMVLGAILTIAELR